MNKNYVKIGIAIAVVTIVSSAVFLMSDTQGLGFRAVKEILTINMVQHAIADYDSNGKMAFTDFDQDSQYRNGEEYVFVIEKETFVIVAHGANLEYIGTLSSDLIDSDGVNIGELIDKNATPDGAWVHYKFLDPQTGKVEPKSSWIVLHDGYIFGVGIYSP